MKYSSLQEYFYKFQNVLYVLVLFPLLAFISLFIFNGLDFSDVVGENFYLREILISLLCIDVLSSFIIFNTRLKSIRKLPGLGLRLEKYYTATVVRFSFLSCAALLMVAGFTLSGSLTYTCLFGAVMILFFLVWPRSGKGCRDLKLKGSEREMVYYKKMTLD
jgi:hypothetical protein